MTGGQDEFILSSGHLVIFTGAFETWIATIGVTQAPFDLDGARRGVNQAAFVTLRMLDPRKTYCARCSC
jgi:hypothetical protein